MQTNTFTLITTGKFRVCMFARHGENIQTPRRDTADGQFLPSATDHRPILVELRLTLYEWPEELTFTATSQNLKQEGPSVFLSVFPTVLYYYYTINEFRITCYPCFCVGSCITFLISQCCQFRNFLMTFKTPRATFLFPQKNSLSLEDSCQYFSVNVVSGLQ